MHCDMTVIFPILDGKVLDVNMTGTFSGNTRIDHFDGRLIVAIDVGGSGLGKTKIGENGAKIFGMFGRRDSSNEFSFGGRGGSNRLGFATIRNAAARHGKGVASDGAATT